MNTAPAISNPPAAAPASRPIARPLLSISAVTALLNSTSEAVIAAVERGEFPVAFDVSGGSPRRRCLRIPTRHVLAYKQGLPVPKGESPAAIIDSILPQRARYRGREVAFWLHLDSDSVCGLIKSRRLAGSIPAKKRDGFTVTRAALAEFLTKNRVF